MIQVKETREALLAMVALGVFVAARAKDGLQLDDAKALAEKLANDPEFKAKIAAGIEGIDKVPGEITAIKVHSLADVLEIAQVIPDLIKELAAVVPPKAA